MSAEVPNPTASKQFKAPPLLEQFENYKEFVEDTLWPALENIAAEIKKLVDDISEKETIGAFDEDAIRNSLARLGEVRNIYKRELVPLMEAVHTGFGPIMRIQYDMLVHSSAKIFNVIELHILERRRNVKQERGGIAISPLMPFEELADQYNFSKNFILSLARSPEDTTSEIKEMRSSEGGTDLKRAIENKVGLIDGEYINKNIQCSVLMSENIRKYVFPFEILTLELIHELVLNAAELHEHGVNHIQVRIKSEDEQFIIEVEDDGPGITRENMPKIFNKGFTTKASGTGKGLYFIKEALEETLSGTISATSEKSKTIFRMEIPDTVNV